MGVVLVAVARMTGQSVRTVAQEPYAITLWTYWHGRQEEARLDVVREDERHAAAQLHALAVNDPAKLRDAREQFIRRVRPVTIVDQAAHAQRMQQMVADHARMQRVDPPVSVNPQEAT